MPVHKTTEAVGMDASLGDRHGMAYSGTLVVYGQARGIVVATAGATELGRINQMLTSIRNLSTPLLRQVDRFGRMLALVILGFCAITFLIGDGLSGIPSSDMFMLLVVMDAFSLPGCVL